MLRKSNHQSDKASPKTASAEPIRAIARMLMAADAEAPELLAGVMDAVGVLSKPVPAAVPTGDPVSTGVAPVL